MAPVVILRLDCVTAQALPVTMAISVSTVSLHGYTCIAIMVTRSRVLACAVAMFELQLMFDPLQCNCSRRIAGQPFLFFAMNLAAVPLVSNNYLIILYLHILWPFISGNEGGQKLFR